MHLLPDQVQALLLVFDGTGWLSELFDAVDDKHQRIESILACNYSCHVLSEYQQHLLQQALEVLFEERNLTCLRFRLSLLVVD